MRSSARVVGRQMMQVLHEHQLLLLLLLLLLLQPHNLCGVLSFSPRLVTL